MADDNGISKPVTEVVKSLAGTPMLLVLVLMNVLILGMITYLAKARSEQIQQERTELLTALHNCIQEIGRNKNG